MVFGSGAHLLHFDAKAHLLVARRVLDSLTPGWTQLGAVWLPLPHILNVLPAQSDYLYRSGLFASVLGAAFFVAGVAALGHAAARGTGDPWAGAVAMAVPVLNPGWLYLQATPMTEPLFLGLVGGLALFVVRWRLDGREARPRGGGRLLRPRLPRPLRGLADRRRRRGGGLRGATAGGRAPPCTRWAPLMLGVGLVGPVLLFGLHTWIATERAFYVIDDGNLTEERGQRHPRGRACWRTGIVRGVRPAARR